MAEEEVPEVTQGEERKGWTRPELTVYGELTVLTRHCGPPTPRGRPGCKPKALGFADDFASHISEL